MWIIRNGDFNVVTSLLDNNGQKLREFIVKYTTNATLLLENIELLKNRCGTLNGITEIFVYISEQEWAEQTDIFNHEFRSIMLSLCGKFEPYNDVPKKVMSVICTFQDFRMNLLAYVVLEHEQQNCLQYGNVLVKKMNMLLSQFQFYLEIQEVLTDTYVLYTLQNNHSDDLQKRSREILEHALNWGYNIGYEAFNDGSTVRHLLNNFTERKQGILIYFGVIYSNDPMLQSYSNLSDRNSYDTRMYSNGITLKTLLEI
jgi:hypothetical protein